MKESAMATLRFKQIASASETDGEYTEAALFGLTEDGRVFEFIRGKFDGGWAALSMDEVK